jgi:hypothetical protein
MVTIRYGAGTSIPEAKAPNGGMTWILGQLLRTIVQSLILTVFVWCIMFAFEQVLPFLGAWALSTVVMIAFRLHRLVGPGRSRWGRAVSRAADQVTSAQFAVMQQGGSLMASTLPGNSRGGGPAANWLDPLPPTLEHRFKRMYRHTDRLTYAVVAERHYDAGVRPILVDLAADRLRRFHGIDLATQPGPARAVLGPDLWQAIYAPLPRPPTTADLDRWIATLERLARR